jgi:lipoate-protein ligase B
MRIAHVLETPRIGVVEAWETQLRLADLCRQGLIGTVIWLLEHEPTYTTGRHGLRSDLVLDDARLAKTGARFVRLDRGGQMTWHGPGQATAYVIGDLRELTRGSVRDSRTHGQIDSGMASTSRSESSGASGSGSQEG